MVAQVHPRPQHLVRWPLLILSGTLTTTMAAFCTSTSCVAANMSAGDAPAGTAQRTRDRVGGQTLAVKREESLPGWAKTGRA